MPRWLQRPTREALVVAAMRAAVILRCMLWTLVKNTEWGPLVSLLSPAFFDVIPARQLLGELRDLSTRYLSRAAFADACEKRTLLLRQAQLPFEIVGSLPAKARASGDGAGGEGTAGCGVRSPPSPFGETTFALAAGRSTRGTTSTTRPASRPVRARAAWARPRRSCARSSEIRRRWCSRCVSSSSASTRSSSGARRRGRDSTPASSRSAWDWRRSTSTSNPAELRLDVRAAFNRCHRGR